MGGLASRNDSLSPRSVVLCSSLVRCLMVAHAAVLTALPLGLQELLKPDVVAPDGTMTTFWGLTGAVSVASPLEGPTLTARKVCQWRC